MKVYSWNMYCFNKKQDEAFAFIQNLDYDVLCLQEVPPEFLERLKKLRVYVEEAVDCERFTKRMKKQYVVIVSKHKILQPEPISFHDIKHPARTKVVIKLMQPAGWTPTKNRNALRAIIKVGNKKFQIFCVHFTLSSPLSRAREFGTILDHRHTELPTIIAGDFNVLEHPAVKPFSWFLGSTLKEALPTYPERKLFEERFNNAKLHNPLLGQITHDFSASQLDHVLHSDELSVKSAGVHPHLYGSDHYPVWVELQ